MPPAVAIFLVAAFIYIIIKSFVWICFAGIIITGIVLIRKGIKQQKLEIEEQARRERYEVQRQEQLARQEINTKRIAEEQTLTERGFQEAIIAGKDVCHNCKTIQPKRCRCNNCIESYKCYEEYRSNNECKECFYRRKKRECDLAREAGHDVCYKCFTIDPDRCNCGNCIVCEGGYPGCCNICD